MDDFEMSEESELPNKVICHFSSKHRWDDTRIFHIECLSLKQAGYQVYYVVLEEREGHRECEGVKIRAVKRPKAGIDRMLRVSIRVYRVIRGLPQRPAICHFHDPELTFVGKVLQWQGYKVIYDVHEIVAQQILDKPYLPRWTRKLVSNLYILAERVFTLSMAHVYVTEAPKHRPMRTAVLRNMPAKGDRPKHQFHCRTFWKMIYVGGLSRSRGAMRVLEVLAHLHKMGKDVKLQMLGWAQPASVREEMLKYISEHNLGEHCYISPGRVEPAKMMQAIYEADFGLCLLDPLQNYVRAFPVKIFEYLRAGLVIVATDIEYWKPMVERIGAGIQVDISDPAQIAQQIASLLADPDRMLNMSHNGRKVAEEHWCREVEQKQLLALYDDFIHDGPGGLFANPSLKDIPLDGLELDEKAAFRE